MTMLKHSSLAIALSFATLLPSAAEAKLVTLTAISNNDVQFARDGIAFYVRQGGGGGGRGFNIAVLDPISFELVGPVRNFDTWSTSASGTEMNAMIRYIGSIQDGSLVMIATADEAGLNPNIPECWQADLDMIRELDWNEIDACLDELEASDHVRTNDLP